MTSRAQKMAMLGISILVSVLLLEIGSRLIFPVFPGARKIAENGAELGENDWRIPGIQYQQLSEEYQVRTTIDANGFRVPSALTEPETLILGDSFTFGQGVADEETFTARFCKEKSWACVNMGQPGAGTVYEMNLLEKTLAERDWHPKRVWLFVLAMTDNFYFYGNDLFDNWQSGQAKASPTAPRQPQPEPKEPGVNRLRALRDHLVGASNLMRIAQFILGPYLKSLWSGKAEGDETMLREALERTAAQFQRLDRLSRERAFDYQIFLLHPKEDLIRGSYAKTLARLNAISPKPLVDTASALLDDPKRHYYRYDGHFTPEGHDRIAEFLKSQAF